jgi:hypothetical protein
VVCPRTVLSGRTILLALASIASKGIWFVSIALEPTARIQASNPSLPKTIPALITESLRACDPELRQVLVGNVVLTGGGSLFAGFGDRLSAELARSFPHVRRRRPVVAQFLPSLRSKSTRQEILSNAATAVGSVEAFWPVWVLFTSFGSAKKSGWCVKSIFWLFRTDCHGFQEHGKAIVGQRCK